MAEITTRWIEDLSSPDAKTRQTAIDALHKMGRAAVPALVLALRAPEEGLRGDAALLLHFLGPEAAEAVPALIQALHDPDARVRWNAADALAGLDREALAAVPALINALEDDNNNVFLNAAHALGGMGLAAVPALLDSLRAPGVQTRNGAAYALGEIGEQAKGAIPALANLLMDRQEQPEVRHACFFALRRVGAPEGQLVGMFRELADDGDDLAEEARRALAEWGRTEPAEPGAAADRGA
jgi:HEAT repeat protein